MTATFMKIKDGSFIEIEYITTLLTGAKWYWLEHNTGDTNKLPTAEFKLMSVEA